MTIVVVALGAVAVAGLLVRVSWANPGANEREPPLVSRSVPPPSPARPDDLVEWESLLLAAATGGARSRARAARHLEPVLASVLAEAAAPSLDDPRSAHLLGDEWRYLRGERPAPTTDADEMTSVLDAVETILDRITTRGHPIT